MSHRSAAFYESGMNPYCPPIPWMPRIADFTEIPNMGVALLSCITPSATIKAKETRCSSPPQSQPLAGAFTAANASAACFDITAAPRD